jgi:signal peptidase II
VISSPSPLVARLLLALVLAGTISCDRVTKRMASATLAGAPDRTFLGGTVTMLYAENTGGFLSVGAGFSPRARTAVFVVGTGLMLLAVATAFSRYRADPWSKLGATLFLAGGASNWIDRLLHGKVVDFLNVGIGPVRTGIFNVADMAIMLGLALLLAAEFGRRHGGLRVR